MRCSILTIYLPKLLNSYKHVRWVGVDTANTRGITLFSILLPGDHIPYKPDSTSILIFWERLHVWRMSDSMNIINKVCISYQHNNLLHKKFRLCRHVVVLHIFLNQTTKYFRFKLSYHTSKKCTIITLFKWPINYIFYIQYFQKNSYAFLKYYARTIVLIN